MSFISKLRTQGIGIILAFLFFAVTGVIFFAGLIMTYFPPHLGVIAIFSLLAAAGLILKRSWTTWFVVVLFLVSTTFSLSMLSYYIYNDATMAAAMLAYLILTWAFTGYTYSKRESLEG